MFYEVGAGHEEANEISILSLCISHVGFVVDGVVLGGFFPGVLWFPCQFSLDKLLHIHQSSYHPTLYSLDTGRTCK
jgi:hypothetical protein